MLWITVQLTNDLFKAAQLKMETSDEGKDEQEEKIKDPKHHYFLKLA